MEEIKSLLNLSKQYGDRLYQISKPFLDAFGASQLCLDRTYANGNYWALNTNYELYDYYLKKDGLLLDPNIKHPVLLSDRFFVWSTCVSEQYSEILKGFNQIFHLQQGVSIARLLSDGSNIGVAFGCNTSDPNFIPKILSEAKLISSFLKYLQKELTDEIEAMQNQTLSLNQYKKDDLMVLDGGMFKLEMDRRKDLLLLMGRLSKDDLWLMNVELTQRQTQCALLYLRGFSVMEIAKQLNISFDAVKSHFELIKKKLKVKNKRELMQKLNTLNELGLLTCEYINLQDVPELNENV